VKVIGGIDSTMRIAYFVPYVPNLIRVRPYQLITHLSRLGIEVTVFTVKTNKKDAEDATALSLKCHDVILQDQSLWHSVLNCLAAIPSNGPLQAVYSWNPKLIKNLENVKSVGELTSDFDLVHVEHLRGSMYGMKAKAMSPDLPVVWDSVDCISHLFKLTSAQSRSAFGRIVSALELKKTRRWEGMLASAFDHVTITSQIDKNALLDLVPAGNKPAPVSILPNGVDLHYFHPGKDNMREPETLVFSGKMSYHANISMVDYLVREIMPKVWAKRPTVRLVIVGKDPPAKVKHLALNPLITVTGTVVDIRPYLWKATVAVVPLVYGAGIQNKILEAMACKTPVVTNSKAMLALQAGVDSKILVADSPEEFSSEVVRLIENRRLQRDMGEAGFAYVQKEHDWNKITKELIVIYEEVIGASRS